MVLLCVALLTYIHRDDLGGQEQAGEAESRDGDPAAACIRQRFADIEGMVQDGMVDPAQATLFRQRAEAMCRATTDGQDGGPPLPTQ